MLLHATDVDVADVAAAEVKIKMNGGYGYGVADVGIMKWLKLLYICLHLYTFTGIELLLSF
jgi:hypothetical protein